MVVSVRGDLLESDADGLVNPVNCVGVMGKGLALQFRTTFPGLFPAYRQACRAGAVVPGRVFAYPVGARWVLNVPTKRHWSRPSRLADVAKGIRALAEEAERLGLRSVAIPQLGCGEGGLDWREVRPYLVEAFQANSVRALLYEDGSGS